MCLYSGTLTVHGLADEMEQARIPKTQTWTVSRDKKLVSWSRSEIKCCQTFVTPYFTPFFDQMFDKGRDIVAYVNQPCTGFILHCCVALEF